MSTHGRAWRPAGSGPAANAATPRLAGALHHWDQFDDVSIDLSEATDQLSPLKEWRNRARVALCRATSIEETAAAALAMLQTGPIGAAEALFAAFDADTAAPVVSRSQHAGEPAADGTKLLSGVLPILAAAIEARRLIAIGTRRQRQELFPRAFLPAPLDQCEAVAAIPLMHEDAALGILLVAFPEARVFGRELPLLMTLADLCTDALVRLRAVSIEHAAGVKAQQAVLRREQMMAEVSHDLRNLASAVVSGTYLVERREAGRGDDDQRAVHALRRSAERMRRLLDDLLDHTAMEAGRLALTLAPVDVRSLLDEAVEAHLGTASLRKVKLSLAACPAELRVCCDEERIQQVLGNLIGNASRFAPVGGSIVLEAAVVDGEVSISVTDDGPGIPLADAEHVFEPFWQARRDRRGLGLGLAIASGIIAAHGGRLWVDGRPGLGARFSFTLAQVLPLAARGAAAPQG